MILANGIDIHCINMPIFKVILYQKLFKIDLGNKIGFRNKNKSTW